VTAQRLVAATIPLAAVLLPEPSAFAADLPGDSDAAHPCRPTVSCTADFAAPGSLEVETGALYSGLGGDQTAWAFPFLLKQTFTKLLQLQAGSNGYTMIQPSSNGPVQRYVDNLVVGPKLHLLDQTAVTPSFAVSAQASLPVSSHTLDGALFTAYASKDFGPLHADWNLGLDVWWGEPGGGAAAPQPFTALALSATPLPPFGVALEGYIVGDAQPYSARDGGIRAAISVTPRPWLVFDAGGDVGWFPSTRAYSAFFGMTVIPVVFWRPDEGDAK
jgi:hypothetical protein